MESFAERLKRLRTEKKETQQALGDAVGVTKQYISNIENGDKTPGKVLTQTLADHFGVDLEYMYCRTDVPNAMNLTGIFEEGYRQGERDYKESIRAKSVPLYSCISCGTGLWVDEVPDDLITVPAGMLSNHHAYFANIAEGDSMTPKIKNGDVLVFEQEDTIDNGLIGSFSLNGEYYCKRFRRLADGSVWLVSENQAYDPIPVKPDDSFRVLGVYRLKISKEQ